MATMMTSTIGAGGRRSRLLAELACSAPKPAPPGKAHHLRRAPAPAEVGQRVSRCWRQRADGPSLRPGWLDRRLRDLDLERRLGSGA